MKHSEIFQNVGTGVAVGGVGLMVQNMCLGNIFFLAYQQSLCSQLFLIKMSEAKILRLVYRYLII